MSNVNTDGLPPEMQARIADIIEKAKTMHLIAKIELTEAFVISNFSCIEGSRTPKEYKSNPSRKTRAIAENTIIQP